MFVVGLLPAVVAFIVRRTLHEPEIFVRKHAARNENTFRFLVKDGKTSRTSLGIAILCSVQTFGYYVMAIGLGNAPLVPPRPAVPESALRVNKPTPSPARNVITVITMNTEVRLIGPPRNLSASTQQSNSALP
jgi:hypothetical protein